MGQLGSGGLLVFKPVSPEAEELSRLFLQVLLVCCVVFLVVGAMILIGTWRFRHHPGSGEPPQRFGNRGVETLWTVVPLLIVAWLWVRSARAMAASDPGGGGEPDLVVVGHQWWWEIRYPKSGIITANEIHIPVGQRWKVRLESADVIHDFWVPQASRKMDMIPGHPNDIWLRSDRPGSFEGACAEYCGMQHAWMRFLLIAEPREDYQSWERSSLRRPAAPRAGPPAEGERLFRKLICTNCHSLGESTPPSRVGPNLAHLASRRRLGAGVLENTPLNLARWLKDPQQAKPGTLMPDFKLTEQEVFELASYLGELR